MSLLPPFPELDELLESLGEAGLRMSEISAVEGAAGNISLCVDWPVDFRGVFPQEETIPLPVESPGLAGRSLLITGSGCRLREVLKHPERNLGALVIDAHGKTGRLFSSPRRLFKRLTSELNSHLIIHQDMASKTNYSAVLHAQPVHLTYLSHIPEYQDFKTLNHSLLRWQPEAIVHLPEGIAVLPFIIPGSDELMQATRQAIAAHSLVIWSKHGIIARSDTSIKQASDRIEYAETAAHYEVFNLNSGGRAPGLTPAEILSMCERYSIRQDLF